MGDHFLNHLREIAMPVYRLYVLNAADQIIAPASELRCRDDADALRIASGYGGKASGIEIWNGTRLVGRVGPVFACVNRN